MRVWLQKAVHILNLYKKELAICILTIIVLFLLVQNNGEGYVYQQRPDLVDDVVVSIPIQETGFEQTVSFEAHDIEYLALRFDVDKVANDYSQTEILVELLQADSSIGSWSIQPDQITNIYYYYIPVNLHHIPAGDVTIRINTIGEAPVGLFVGNSSAGISADY
ncbi:MAG: hypothetical protein K5682_02505, partial [Lachnospiraceae bacterium]|nr:hypothetical protein [Lachnospiraceae bacterium]